MMIKHIAYGASLALAVVAAFAIGWIAGDIVNALFQSYSVGAVYAGLIAFVVVGGIIGWRRRL